MESHLSCAHSKLLECLIGYGPLLPSDIDAINARAGGETVIWDPVKTPLFLGCGQRDSWRMDQDIGFAFGIREPQRT